jgi:RimJ/RimL family protein N-acetyltransferase
MNILIETERLILREFTIHDTAFIIALLNSDGWMEFIGDRNVKTEEEARNYLENGPLKSYEIFGYGLSLVELKSDKTPIGMCGIINRASLENPDIGFSFLPEYTGKGYAHEMAKATMVYAREILNLPTICAITVANNKASIKLLEKIGLEFMKPIYFPEDNEELLLYSN